MTSKILHDPKSKYSDLTAKYSFLYPDRLRNNIILKNRELLDGRIPSYANQIEKAMKRGGYISINHRITEILASYFDIIFAVNGKYHPREKNLIIICLEQCEALPVDNRIDF